jgi:hypothetical protein
MSRSLKVNNNTPMDAPPVPNLQFDLRLEAQTRFEERQDVASVAQFQNLVGFTFSREALAWRRRVL